MTAARASMILVSLATLAFTGLAAAGGDVNVDFPHLNHHLRVKQHRSGAQGDLVKGEEHLVKTIIGWVAFPGATEYELCIDCHIEDDTGVREKEEKGKIEVKLNTRRVLF